MRSHKIWDLFLAIGTIGLLVGIVFYLGFTQGGGGQTNVPCFTGAGTSVSSTDLTGALGTAFSRGAIQAFGSNSTSVILGGLSFFGRNAEPSDSEPGAVTLTDVTSSTPGSHNLTSALYRYFNQGGIFPVGWNGTAWLVAGQTTLNGLSVGSAVSLEGGRITNLTGLVEPYFHGTQRSQYVGIWIAGWDGNGWLIGGNSSWGASLVYLEGNHVTNLSADLAGNHPGYWVQMVVWNGTGWLIGGRGVLAAWQDGRFTNLFANSPYVSGGIYAIAKAGPEWIIGGSPGQLSIVNGSRILEGPRLTQGFGAWVNTIVPAGAGWLVGGGGYNSTKGHTTQLAYVPGIAGSVTTYDTSACLPQGFEGGWVQYGAPIPSVDPQEVILVGVGGVNATTETGHGEALLLRATVA